MIALLLSLLLAAPSSARSFSVSPSGSRSTPSYSAPRYSAPAPSPSRNLSIAPSGSASAPRATATSPSTITGSKSNLSIAPTGARPGTASTPSVVTQSPAIPVYRSVSPVIVSHQATPSVVVVGSPSPLVIPAAPIIVGSSAPVYTDSGGTVVAGGVDSQEGFVIAIVLIGLIAVAAVAWFAFRD